LPEVEERLSHGHPAWFVQSKKTFVTLCASPLVRKSHYNLLSKLRRLLWAYTSEPQLDEDEQVILDGKIVLVQGFAGGRIGLLLLTNRRIIWRERSVARPLKPIQGEIRLRDVASVDDGSMFDFLLRVKPIRLHLRNGRDKCLVTPDGKVDHWITTIHTLIAGQSRVPESLSQ